MCNRFIPVALGLLALSFSGCAWVEHLLTPDAAGNSPLMTDAGKIAPLIPVYGQYALEIAGAATGIYSTLAHIFGWHQPTPDPMPAPVKPS
jgi:hypothetical protein